MPVGAARASEYAGWWNTGLVPPYALSDVTFTTATNQPFLGVSPRYYADFSSQTGGESRSVYLGSTPTSSNFDMTGITTEPKRFVRSITFKPGSNWLSGASGFLNGNAFRATFNNNGTNYEYRFLMNYNNALQLTPSDSFDGMIVTTAVSGLRNQWLAWIAAYSDSSSTFANWSATGTDTYGWYQRQMLVNITTGTIVTQKDAYATSAAYAYDLTQTWSGGGTSYYYQEEIGTNTNWTTDEWRDMDLASIWSTVGNTFDPASNWQYIVGDATPSTFNGQLAWTNTIFKGAGTALTDAFGTYGYQQTVGRLSSRQPTGWVAQILSNGGSAVTAPVWTSF